MHGVDSKGLAAHGIAEFYHRGVARSCGTIDRMMAPHRDRLAPLALVVVSLLALACSSGPRRLPTLEALATQDTRVPVVLVPGISGTELIDEESGETLWGDGRNLLLPWDGGYSVARSIRLGLEEDDGLVPGAVIEDMDLYGIVRKAIYGPVPRMLERHGYVRGDLDAPAAGETLFLFPYDWRDVNVRAARRLTERLEALAQRIASASETVDEPVPIDLICQSNGAHVCRYVLKFGRASLEDALAGTARPSPSFRIRKLLLVGTSNGGGLRLLRVIDRGRRYVPVVGREILPEVMFTMPAFFEDLPVYEPTPFVDVQGRPLDVGLFDAESWVRYGWSVFDDEVRARLAEADRPDLFGTEEERIEFLRQMLSRAQALHEAIGRDVPIGDTEIYLLQNGYWPTPHLGVLESKRSAGDDASDDGETNDDWRLLFTGDEELEDRPYLLALVSQPGDGHATVESQRALTPSELANLAAAPYLVQDSHFELILHPGTLRRILDFLAR